MRRNPRIWNRPRTGKKQSSERWTEAELDLVRKNYPDYDAMAELLPKRTRKALFQRADLLGLTVNRNSWSAREVSRLIRLRVTGMTVTQLLDEFPRRTRGQLEDQLRENRIFIRKRPVEVPDPFRHAIRQRAFDRGLSIWALNRQIGAPGYFDHGLTASRDIAKIAAATEFLDGELYIEWEPLK